MCQAELPLVKAHIIPKCMYDPIKDNGFDGVPTIYSNIPKQYPKKTPIGIWDDEITCQACDARLGVLDEYVCRILIGFAGAVEIKRGNRLIGYQINDVNQTKLHRGLLSILWRSHHARHPFFGKVELGPHEEKIKAIIAEKSAPCPQDYSAIIAKFDAEEGQSFMMSPDRTRHDGVNFQRFWISGYNLLIKVDRQPTPPELMAVALGVSNSLTILCRSWKKSRDRRALVRVAKQATVPASYRKNS